jgi:hypothetical protein
MDDDPQALWVVGVRALAECLQRTTHLVSFSQAYPPGTSCNLAGILSLHIVGAHRDGCSLGLRSLVLQLSHVLRIVVHSAGAGQKEDQTAQLHGESNTS